MLFTACGGTPADDRAFLLSEGDWVWGEQADCETPSDLIHISGEWFDIYSNNTKTGRGKFVERIATLTEGGEGSGGKANGARWIYIAPHPDDPTRLVRHDQQFTARRTAGRITHLVSSNRRTLTDPDTLETSRIDDPRAGQRLTHCP